MTSVDDTKRPFGLTDKQSYDYITIAARYGLYGDAPYEFLAEIEELLTTPPA